MILFNISSERFLFLTTVFIVISPFVAVRNIPIWAKMVFKTDREYPKFVIQEMTVNSVCHRDYSIKRERLMS